jgi:hypothetical protein
MINPIFRKISILVSLILLTNSCCNKSNENSGSIIADLNIDNFPYYQQLDCYNIPDTCCIRDDSTYKSIFSIIAPSSNCDQLTLPNIDFEKTSILIYKIFEHSIAYFHKNVEIDTMNKTATYSISISHCICPDQCRTYSYNIVVVPKIPIDYKIIFK